MEDSKTNKQLRDNKSMRITQIFFSLIVLIIFLFGGSILEKMLFWLGVRIIVSIILYLSISIRKRVHGTALDILSNFSLEEYETLDYRIEELKKCEKARAKSARIVWLALFSFVTLGYLVISDMIIVLYVWEKILIIIWLIMAFVIVGGDNLAYGEEVKECAQDCAKIIGGQDESS